MAPSNRHPEADMDEAIRSTAGDVAPLSRTGLVLLMAGGSLGNIAANHLAREFADLVVLREKPESKAAILKRRARLVGPLSAAGQAAAGLVFRLLEKTSRHRVAEICEAGGLDPAPPRHARIMDVDSVNSEACRTALRELNPAAVAVYGTRIIGRKTLGCIPAPFVNYHAGINPKYRGQHPGYWARANRDPDHTGITIHLVDTGVDTGDVLAQERVALGSRDNICTYQYVQMAAALPVFTRCLLEAQKGIHAPRKVDLPSSLYFPPTVWRYAWNGFRHGVW
jgi:folate-dependent phosphoribosylglycinamide formyltransferase PurN